MSLATTRPLPAARRLVALAAALAALAGCGGERPVGPAGYGAPAGFRITTKLAEGLAPGALGIGTDTLVVAVHDRSRRIAGPTSILPDSTGRFAAVLEAPSGPDRVVAIEALGISYYDVTETPVRGTILLGLSDPFTLETDATDSVTVTFAPFTTQFIQPASQYTGAATFHWDGVPGATTYRVRESLPDAAFVDRTTADTALTIAADDEGTGLPRVFQVRAENRFAAGAWSPPIAAVIVGQPGGPAWTLLDDGSGPGPGILFGQSGAFHRDTRTFYIYGGAALGDTFAVTDTTLWAFSLGAPGWRAVASGGTNGPGPRLSSALAVAPDGSRVYVFGNGGQGGLSALDLWSYDLKANRWLRLDDGSAAEAAGIPFGTETEARFWAATGNTYLGLYAPITGQVFRFEIGQRVWGEVPATGGPIATRTGPAVAYDAASAGLAVFGGILASTDSLTNELLTFSETTGLWQAVVPENGPIPPGRGSAAAAFEAGLGLLVFGGYTYDAATVPWDDVWLYQPGSRTAPAGWARVVPHGGLGVRPQAVIGFDPATRSLIVTGGLTFEHSVWSVPIP